MGAMASQITSLTIVYSTVYSGADQSKHQSSASLAFVCGIHRGPVNSLHKWPVTRKCFHLITSSCSWDPIMMNIHAQMWICYVCLWIFPAITLAPVRNDPYQSNASVLWIIACHYSTKYYPNQQNMSQTPSTLTSNTLPAEVLMIFVSPISAGTSGWARRYLTHTPCPRRRCRRRCTGHWSWRTTQGLCRP